MTTVYPRESEFSVLAEGQEGSEVQKLCAPTAAICTRNTLVIAEKLQLAILVLQSTIKHRMVTWSRPTCVADEVMFFVTVSTSRDCNA